MRFAEVFFRLGCALVAWMMLYAHFLWLAASRVMGCGPDGDEMYRLLLGFAPFTCGFAFLLQMTRPFAEIHGILRWLGLPLFALLPFALASIWQAFGITILESLAICGDGVAESWQVAWAPTQLVTLCVAAFMVVRVWQTATQDAPRKAGKMEHSN